MKPKTTLRKYRADVYEDEVVALFPDGTIRPFRNTDECEKAIRKDHSTHRVRKDEMSVSVIEWNFAYYVTIKQKLSGETSAQSRRVNRPRAGSTTTAEPT